MIWYIVKLVISAGIIVLISELSKKLPLLASLIASLPLISVLGMIWMYAEKVEIQKIASHAEGTFWHVLPSLPMFLLLPWMLKKESHFCLLGGRNCPNWSTLFLMTKVLAKFGMNL